MPQLKEWKFVNGFYMYKLPEIDGDNNITKTRIFGRVYNDTRKSMTGEFDDGHRILSSPIVEINWENMYVMTRSGTKYDLIGEPDEEYGKWLGEKKELRKSFN